jgi:multiple sugar transport system permease protein
MRRTRPLFTAYLPVMPFVFFALFPLYFMLVTSFKKNAELYDVNAVPFLIGRGVTFGHYELLSKDTLFWSWFVNSLIVSVAATVISVVLGVLAAYPLARLKFPGGDSFGVAIFVTYLVPPSLLCRFCSCRSAASWPVSGSRTVCGRSWSPTRRFSFPSAPGS